MEIDELTDHLEWHNGLKYFYFQPQANPEHFLIPSQVVLLLLCFFASKHSVDQPEKFGNQNSELVKP